VVTLIKKLFVLLIVFSLVFPPGVALAQSGSEALVSYALTYYNRGFYQEALHEFKKALLADPDNKEAIRYIKEIRSKHIPTKEESVNDVLNQFEQMSLMTNVQVDKAVMVNREMDRFTVKKKSRRAQPQDNIPDYMKETEKSSGPKVDVKGEYQVAFGVRSNGDFIWKDANGDLNERNYRILWGDAKYNTYDPAIFDRLRLDLDIDKFSDEENEFLNNLSAHVNLTVDPWSFTGKTDKFTLNGVGGDAADFQLKWWANTGYTINEIVPTLSNGDAMALPEIKVIDGMTSPTRVSTTFSNIFSIPAKKVSTTFMPVRELWFDYKEEPVKFRFFPMGYQDQALTSDDPLALSNRHTWWEESPWLAEWKPGTLNTGATPDDFSKGIWDDSLAFFTRDSDGLRLTALRGMAFEYDGVDMSLKSTLASPKNLWQDYGVFQTYASATRLKYDLAYNLGVGLTNTTHFGYNGGDLDGVNYVFGADAKYEPFLGTRVNAEVAMSQATFDRTVEAFTSEKHGNAYFVSLENRFPQDDIYEHDFNAIRKIDAETSFLKSKIRLARMDTDFESSLASFHQTRDDEFWSRHISFRKHPLYLYTGLNKPMNFEDIKTFAIGDGLDAGRNVIGWRLEGETLFFGRNLDALFDVRNVHNVNGDFIENVSRLESSYEVTDKLTTRILGISQDMPDTVAGYDPFIFDSVTGKPLVNTAIVGGEDPSLKTGSLGFNYEFSKQFSVNTVWEHTNDSNVATDNYPRGLFNSSSFTTSIEDGKVYREPIPFLYGQQNFPMPPYNYFDIYKLGFSFTPFEQIEFYLDCAYNENKKAGQIDDNMNHYGLEIAYTPTQKWAFLFKYTHSRWVDLNTLNSSGQAFYQWHNNFFVESRYHVSENSEFIFDYGVGGITPLGSSLYDPFGGALAVLDTQHIVRVYYKKKF